MALLEAILLPIFIPLIILMFGVRDIFLLETAFPWLILIPTLTASRYGTWYGLLSLAIFSLLCLTYTSIFQPSLFSVAIQILAGGLMLVVFIGEMTQRWKQRNEQQIKLLKQQQINSSQSEQALQLLHISYSQLEEELVATTQSLSNSLRLIDVSIEQKTLTKNERLQLALNKMQSILKQYDWLESAAFYYVDNKGKINPKILSRIGLIPPNLHLAPLLSKVIESKKAISVSQHVSGKKDTNNSQPLLQAAMPLLDGNGHLWGVLAVNRMTPSIFMQQNLNLLALLCTYVANLLGNTQRAMSQSELLFLEMFTSLNVVLNTVKSLTLITTEIKNSLHTDEYQKFFVSKIHGANRFWQLQQKKKIILIILLPLLNTENTPQWQEILESNFQKQFGMSFEQANIKLSPTHFNKKTLRSSLKKYLDNISEFDHAHLIR